MIFKLVGGDFPKSTTLIKVFGNLYLHPHKFSSKGKVDLAGQIESIQVITEENKKKIAGAAGWGLAGGLLLGPVGVLAGVLAGGKKQEICFVCVLKDGRRFIAIAESKVYQLLATEQLQAEPMAPPLRSAMVQQPSVSNEMVCSNCGENAAPEARFCSNCGQALTSVLPESVSATSTTDPNSGPPQFYSVVIDGVTSPIYVIKAIREITLLGLVEAKKMSDRAKAGIATAVRDHMRKEDALEACVQLKAAGASVYVLDGRGQKVNVPEPVPAINCQIDKSGLEERLGSPFQNSSVVARKREERKKTMKRWKKIALWAVVVFTFLVVLGAVLPDPKTNIPNEANQSG
ncbi:MAG: ribosomal protein L7/L12, partial [Candidatus Angelobacter sp.]